MRKICNGHVAGVRIFLRFEMVRSMQIIPRDRRSCGTCFLTFPDDGKRHEIIDGEHYVTPSPNTKHQTRSISPGRVGCRVGRPGDGGPRAALMFPTKGR